MAAEVDARTKETAATLVDVASGRVKFHDSNTITATALQHQGNVVPMEASARSPTATNTTTRPLSTTVGLGIDPCLVIANQDATEAAIKAVRDAIDRCVVRFPINMHSNLQMQVKLGVPSKQSDSKEPMNVDMTRLVHVLPSIAFLPMEVVVGGLLVPQSNSSAVENCAEATGLCTVVACISLQQHQQPNESHNEPDGMASPTSVASSVARSNQASPTLEAVVAPPASWTEVEQPQPQHIHQPSMGPPYASSQSALQPALPTARPLVSHSTSMEMLARISAEIHEQQPMLPVSGSSNAMLNGPASVAMREYMDANGLSNYKKLPPGMTPKNNMRLFVKHSYRDYSHDIPLAEELALLGPNAPHFTPNSAFPLKLHEILSHIEHDGHDDIIGWLPHGRSFKIHKQKEFVQTVLPKYFVMTKKSSFLRQLNLYGFNRLSGIGPDQGSYCHEKFLRGLKYLSRRMSRQKVNGNVIRAAGNPDDEPILSYFPSCPPTARAHVIHGHRGPVACNAAVVVNSKSNDSSNNSSDSTAVSTVHSKESLDGITDPILQLTAGIQVSFPLKLQRILDKLEAEGKTDIISWLPHGRAFLVHDSDALVAEFLPVYFTQTRYSSFQRQLHMYNFQRITAGKDKGAYHHANFQRGKPQVSLKMHRTRVNGKGTRRPGNPEDEPDLYGMEGLPVIATGTKIEIPVELPNVDEDEGSAASGSGDSMNTKG